MDNHKRRIKMKGGAEYDALHRYSRGIYCYLTRSKTAKKIKRKDWIEDYFLQGAAYANAHNVMYETNIDSIAILMVDRDLLFKEFLVEKKEFDSFTGRWKQRIIEYYKTHEILGRE